MEEAAARGLIAGSGMYSGMQGGYVGRTAGNNSPSTQLTLMSRKELCGVWGGGQGAGNEQEMSLPATGLKLAVVTGPYLGLQGR